MFRLYQQETPTLPFVDYAKIIEEVRQAGAKTALEFGPGYTTLALIEAGLEKIVSLEDNPEWAEKKRTEFKDYPQVTVALYDNKPVVTADPVADQAFGIAVVDAPSGFIHAIPGRMPRVRHPGMEDCSRLNTCLFALERAPVVLLHDAKRPLERATLGRLNAMGHTHVMLGGLARITRNANASEPSPQGA